MMSDPKLPRRVSIVLRQLPLLEVLEGFWERAGELRAAVIARGQKAHLADALIAQCCLDHDLPLVTRDADFARYVKAGGLRLLP